MQYVIYIAIFLISAVIFTMVGVTIRKKIAESKMKSAEQEAKRIIDAAVRDAENKKKEEIFKAKEEIMKAREELDQEVKERRGEVLLQERRIVQKEENLENRTNNLEKKEKDLEFKNQKLDEKTKEIELTLEKQMQELQRISGLSKDDAKKQLLSELEKDLTLEKANLIKEYENKVKENSEKTAKELIGYAIQKCAADHTSETTVSIVELPNDDMKGRIIGREGRNIKAIETLSGVDLIIDDTPEAVVLSSFDPLRREIARVMLETLIKDGRVHPTRIEEVYDKVAKEMKEQIMDYGNGALFELGVTKMNPELIELVGKLHFRTSYGQNALSHSLEVAELAGLMAAEIGEDVNLAKRAGLLHDIGKAVDHEIEGSHVSIGVDLAKKYGEGEVVINAIASHHGDTDSTSVIANLVAIADALSASRPGARNDSLENYIRRLTELEAVASDIEGVSKSYAMQAGRELRVIVEPEKVDDLQAHRIAREIKEKIETTLKYPGTIKIAVVRETRALEEAK